MDYKDMVFAIKQYGSVPSVDQCRKCAYWSGGDMSKCIPKMTQDVSKAVEDLLERAEKAEMERDAAVNDLSLAPKCKTCAHQSKTGKPFICIGCVNWSNWKWRGIKEE